MPSPMMTAMIPITTACMAPPFRASSVRASLLALRDLRLHLLASRLLLGQVVAHLLQLGLHRSKLVGQLPLARRGLLRLSEPGLGLVGLGLQRLGLGAPQ